MRLRTTLLGLLALIGVVLAGTVYTGFALHKGDIVDQERQDLEVTAEGIAENLAARIEEKSRTVELVAAEPAAGGHGTPAQSALLDRFISNSEFDGVSTVAANGTIVAIRARNLSESQRDALVGSNFDHRQYVESALAGETYVGNPLEAESGNYIVTISTPIVADGEVVGVFTGTLHLGRSRLFSRLDDLHEPGEHLEITSGGQTLYVTGAGEREPPSGEDLVATSTVPNTTWTLWLTQRSSVVEDRLWGVTTVQTGAVALAIALIAIVGLGVYRTTIKHVDELIHGLTRLEAGEYEHELELGVTDEWERISSQFTALADGLAQRDSQLTVLNRVLRHNLRNDMSVIIAHAETLLSGSSDTDDETHLQAIRKTAYNLVETGEHARTIYEKLLAGRNVDRTPVDVATVVERRAEQLRADFPESTVETDVPSEAWAVDRDAVQIVVDELARNALVHNDDPPADRWVSISAESDRGDDTVAVVVRDNGPGLPAVEVELLTGSREETTIEHGSGLGLWVVNWLVEQLDGEISLEPAEGGGTTITVVLPAVDRPTAQSATEQRDGHGEPDNGGPSGVDRVNQ